MTKKLKLGLFHSTIREDEKFIIEKAKQEHLDWTLMDARSAVLNPDTWKDKFDVVLQRCISATIGSQVTLFFERLGIPVVNSSVVFENCENKFATSLILRENNVPTIPFALCFTEEQAKKAVEELGGYPVVIKPVSGSWGRLLAKVNDDDALEAVIEQKMILGSPIHKALYFQKYVEKPGRDIRVAVVGGKVLCAIYRKTTHWISNTARGAEAQKCPIGRDLENICLSGSRAVGGGILGIDVFETDSGLVINEINHTMEFKNVQKTTGVNVASKIISFARKAAIK